MLFLKLPWQPKSKMPFFPYPRDYWGDDEERYSWTLADVKYAMSLGWYNISLQMEDEYPYQKGVMHGTDPEGLGNWYLPKRPYKMTERVNPDPKRYTKYCEYCNKWHIAGASYSCGPDSAWNREYDPIGDLEAVIKDIEKTGFEPVPITFHESVARDNFRQGIQQLYLLGWSSEQVVNLVKRIADKTE